MISLVLAIPPRELFLRLAGEAGISQAELDAGLTVREFQRRISLARDIMCERPTLRNLPVTDSISVLPEVFDEAPTIEVRG